MHIRSLILIEQDDHNIRNYLILIVDIELYSTGYMLFMILSHYKFLIILHLITFVYHYLHLETINYVVYYYCYDY